MIFVWVLLFAGVTGFLVFVFLFCCFDLLFGLFGFGFRIWWFGLLVVVYLVLDGLVALWLD